MDQELETGKELVYRGLEIRRQIDDLAHDCFVLNTLNAEAFENLLTQYELVQRQMRPIFEDIAAEYDQKIRAMNQLHRDFEQLHLEKLQYFSARRMRRNRDEGQHNVANILNPPPLPPFPVIPPINFESPLFLNPGLLDDEK